MFKILIYQIAALGKVASDVYGWLLATLCGVVTFFAPEQYTFLVVMVSIGADAFFGVWASLLRGQFILSKLGRATLAKVTSYSAALVMLFMVERLAHDGTFIGVRVAAAWAAACEFWSMSASVLIIWPNAAFFKILRRHLRGEIEAKLGGNIDDILPDKK